MTCILFFLDILRYYIGNKLLFGRGIKHWWLSLIGGGIYFIVFYIHTDLWGKEVVYLMAYVIAGISGFFMFYGTIWKKILNIISLLCIFMCVDEVIGLLLSTLWNVKYTMEKQGVIECLLSIGVLLCLCLVKKFVEGYRNKKGETYDIVVVYAIVFLSLFMIGTIGGMINSQSYLINEEAKWYLNIDGIIAYVFVIGLILFALYIEKSSEEKRRLIETERMLADMQKGYYMTLLEREEETRKYRHDMNNHLMCLNEFVRKQENDEAVNYIANLQDKLIDIRTKCYASGNDILDILLNNQLASLKDVEVSVVGKCKHQPDISNVDLCIIFSNLIKNAIEELEREDYLNKYIKVNIKSGSTYVMIEIRNTSNLLIKENGKQIRSKKSDVRNHGFGLENVVETVRNNGGTFLLTGDGKEVCAKVILEVRR